MSGDVLDNLLVAIEAGLLGDLEIALLDANGVLKLSGGEGERVPEPVVGFDPVLAEEVVGGVAIVADGDGAVTGFKPGVVVILHDVAVGAGFWIVGKIRSPLGVNEGERTDSTSDTDRSANNDPFNCARFHPPDKVALVELTRK